MDDKYGEPPSTAEIVLLVGVLSLAIRRYIQNRARRTIVENAKKDPVQPKCRWVVEADACDYCKARGAFWVEPGEVPTDSHGGCKCHLDASWCDNEVFYSYDSDYYNDTREWLASNYPEEYKKWRAAVLTISEKKTAQNLRKHIPGTKEFRGEQLTSYFYVDNTEPVEKRVQRVRALIDEYAGAGVPIVNELGIWEGKERVTCSKIIGVDGWSGTETRTMTIHYGEKKIHAVPRYDESGKSLGKH